MTIQAAIHDIQRFWKTEDAFTFGQFNNHQHLEKLKNEFSTSLPEDVKTYVTQFAPVKDFYFDTVGNPMRIYGIENLKYIQDGYNYNSVTKSVIKEWNDNWFLIGDEGADPVLVDLENEQEGVQKFQHGAGSWDYGSTIADTIGQFLLCCAAQHFALNNFDDEVILDDENGFTLSPTAAKWYFPKMKAGVGNYYEAWCSDFDNR